MRMLMCVGARVYVCAWVRVYINIYINIFKRFHIVWRTCFSDVSSLVGCWFAAGEEEGEKELLAVITQMCRIFLESFTSHKNPSVFKTCFLPHTLCTSRQFIAGPHENTNKDIHTHLHTYGQFNSQLATHAEHATSHRQVPAPESNPQPS